MFNPSTRRGFTQTEKNVVIKLVSFPKFVIGNLNRLPFTNSGFTLIEVLVVVLIIGILGAIALPQYQKAVLKSKFTALMPIGKTLANSNEAYYLEHGEYASNPQDLPVSIRQNYPDGTSVVLYPGTDDLSFVRVNNTGVPNAQYVVYQKHSANFPDTTWCEAGNTRAEEVCTALGGVIPEGLTGNSSGSDGWKAYLLTGTAREGDSFAETGTNSGTDTSGSSCNATDKPADIAPTETNPATGTATCVNGQWKYQWTGGKEYTENYRTGMPVCDTPTAYACAGGKFKGYYNRCVAKAESACAGSTFSGTYSSCTASENTNGCANSTFSGERSNCYGGYTNNCAGSTFSGSDSYCQGYATEGCVGSTFKAGAYCNALGSGGCNGVIYEEGAWCQGSYCPSGSPKQGGGVW